MCGIVGAYIPKSSKLRGKMGDLVRNLMILSQLRGEDGAGIFSFNENDTIQKGMVKHKQLGTIKELLESKDLIGWRSKDYVVGHTRWKTAGEVTPENAHPFQHGDITMCHNGTLERYYDMSKLYNVPNDINVDSEALCYSMSQASIKQEELDEELAAKDDNYVGDSSNYAFLEPFKKMRGAYAVVLRSELYDGLFFMRNSARTLYYAEIGKNGSEGYVWASEPGMIIFALARVCDLTQGKEYKIHEFKTGKLYNLSAKGMDIVGDVPESELKSVVISYYDNLYGTSDDDLLGTTSRSMGRSKAPTKVVCLTIEVHETANGLKVVGVDKLGRLCVVTKYDQGLPPAYFSATEYHNTSLNSEGYTQLFNIQPVPRNTMWPDEIKHLEKVAEKLSA